MTFTTTWTFNNTFEGWDFTETLVDGVGAAVRSHVPGSTRINLQIPSGGSDKTVFGTNQSSDISGIYPLIVAGDSIEVDFSATSDAVDYRVYFRAIYTDMSQDETLVTGTVAGSLSINLDAGKTLKYIEFEGWNKSSLGINHYRDFTEVRLITQNETGTILGMIQTPSSFISDQGASAAGGAGGGFDNIAAISADGLYVYLAAFNNLGFPVIIKILAALSSDGSVVFNPGAGGRIGVECGELNADNVYAAGQFDGTNTVEKSDDAGATFSVIDDGSFGTIRTFQIGPGNDNRILVFDGDNGDIIETLDGGTTWTDISTAISQVINSIARFDINLEEIVAANQGAANDSIDYSPNSGADLEDYQTGVYPNANATKVIAN